MTEADGNAFAPNKSLTIGYGAQFAGDGSQFGSDGSQFGSDGAQVAGDGAQVADDGGARDVWRESASDACNAGALQVSADAVRAEALDNAGSKNDAVLDSSAAPHYNVASFKEVPVASVERDGSISFAGFYGFGDDTPLAPADEEEGGDGDTDEPEDGGEPQFEGHDKDHGRGRGTDESEEEKEGSEKQNHSPVCRPGDDESTSPDKPLLPRLEAAPPPVPAEYQALADTQQLEVQAVETNGHVEYVYSAKIGDKDIEVLRTSEPPARAEDQLKQTQEDLIAHLEHQFNVRIARDGETAKPFDGEGDELPITTPTLGELKALEQGLIRSAPDTGSPNGEPVRIIIGDKGQDWGAIGFHRDGEVMVTASDNLDYLAEVTIHEFAHVGQSELFATPGAEAAYADKLGWIRVGDDWLLRGKDGSYWKKVEDEDKWIRTDAEGNPADEHGNRVDNPWNPFDRGEDNPRTQTRTSEEMRDIARVKPYSNYFTNPSEMGAAMVTPFRDGRELRARLFHESPESYQIARQMDQDLIDKEFGVQADGQPKMIRNPDGILVENTAEHRQEVEQYESGFMR